MSDTSLDPMIVDAINQAAKAVMTPGEVAASGAGKAYQMVAQAAALAVQDAADSLRNVATLADTASAAALTQLLASGDPKYAQIVELAKTMKADALRSFDATVASAAKAVSTFPPTGPN